MAKSDEVRKLKKEEFLRYYSQLPNQKLASGFVGVDEDTIINWKKSDKEFSDAVASAKSQWALDNSRRVRSKEWLLERVLQDDFGEKKQHEVSGGIKIEIVESPRIKEDGQDTT